MADNQLNITNGELVTLTQQGGLDTVHKHSCLYFNNIINPL